MDETYIATSEAHQEALTAKKIAESTAKAFRSDDLKPEQYIRRDCEDCEDDLPEFRMKKGFTRCTQCQDDKDKGIVRR